MHLYSFTNGEYRLAFVALVVPCYLPMYILFLHVFPTAALSNCGERILKEPPAFSTTVFAADLQSLDGSLPLLNYLMIASS